MPLPLSLQELGEKDGFEDGWHDAMEGLPKNPRPEVGYGLVDARYFGSYSASYRDGHETGKSERIRRQKLKARRIQQNEPEQEQE